MSVERLPVAHHTAGRQACVLLQRPAELQAHVWSLHMLLWELNGVAY